MVSYYSSMYSKNHGSNLPYAGSWYPANYHHSSNPQFLGDNDMTPHQAMYYNHQFFQTSPDWAAHEASILQQPIVHLNQHGGNSEHITDGLHSTPLSPPTTGSAGSEMSSPGPAIGSASPQISTRPNPIKSPYEWMKKPSYQSQPHSGN